MQTPEAGRGNRTFPQGLLFPHLAAALAQQRAHTVVALPHVVAASDRMVASLAHTVAASAFVVASLAHMVASLALMDAFLALTVASLALMVAFLALMVASFGGHGRVLGAHEK